MSYVDAAAAQVIYILSAFIHEATDQSVVAENNAGDLGDVLVALILADVASMIHEAGHQIASPSFLLITLLYLKGKKTKVVSAQHTVSGQKNP